MIKNDQIHKNHRNRMKNTFLEHGFTTFTEIQKLEFMLFFAIPQKDVNPLAHALLAEFGSLNKVLSADFENLLKIDGVGTHTALLLKTFKAVAAEVPTLEPLTKISGSLVAKEYCYHLMRHSDVEDFYVICLNDVNKILKTKKINSGTANKVHVEISEITKVIITNKATKVIVAHNHPSGSMEFSDDDMHITNNIMCNCLLNDVELIDHVLVSPTEVMSLAEDGRLDFVKNTCVNSLNLPVKIPSPSAPYEDYIVFGRDTENK